ncbi:MAG TPA: hypothetical protein DCE56_43860, partial [Cyanobacteria bacterium UBA8553]|nr:hypothetical protein [Cyanobacteria bacterium UBA8553]
MLELLVVESMSCRLLLIECYLAVRGQIELAQLGWESWVLVAKKLGLSAVVSALCRRQLMELVSS